MRLKDMVSLTQYDEGSSQSNPAKAEDAQDDFQARWEATMLDRLEELRVALRQDPLEKLALRSGAELENNTLQLTYWGSLVRVTWPDIKALDVLREQPCSLFDTMQLLYYLHCADGTPQADRWISFRELPGGVFYHQAFQSYSGDRLAKVFQAKPELLHPSATRLGGIRLTGLSEFAYAFQPLPRLRLAAILWPGDEEFPSRGAILFDASSAHYMVIDGLAILGARLVGKLQHQMGH
jgi:hypothetical protein